MTNRQRFLNVISGQKADKLLFTPRLDIWYNYKLATNSLPDEYKGKSIEDIRLSLGVAMSARKGVIFKLSHSTSTFTTTPDNRGGCTNIIENKAGRIQEKFATVLDDGGNAIKPERTEYFLKSEDDFLVMKEHIKSMVFNQCYEEFEKYDSEIGDEMLPLTIVGDVPAMVILRDMIGYNECYYHLADWPELVEELIDEYEKSLLPMQDIMLNSSAKLFLHGMHFDSQMTPPHIFSKYITPYYKRLMPKIKQSGKFIAVHQDGDASLLLDELKNAGIQIADCMCTQPMCGLSVEKAYEELNNDITIWGGIPSVILNPENCSMEEFMDYTQRAIEVAKKGNMILSVSDNVMPEADLSRLKIIAELINS